MYSKYKFESKGVYWATMRDIPYIAEMGNHFFDASGYGDFLDYDKESLIKTLEALMGNEDFIMLVVKKNGRIVGSAAAMLYPFYFNFNHKTGTELFYWVEPEHRGSGVALLRALEFFAKQGGAETFAMVSLERLDPEGVDRLYKKLGYNIREHSYVKGL